MISWAILSPMQPPPVSGARKFLMFPLTRLILAFVIFSVLTSLGVFAAFALGAAPSPFLFEAVQAASAVVTLILLAGTIERRPASEAGLGTSGWAKELGLGAGLGAVLIALVALMFLLAGWYRVVGTSWERGLQPAALLAEAAAFFLLVGIAEEVLFRGILFRVLEEGLGSWIAMALTGVLFGLVHAGNPNASAAGLIGIAVVDILFVAAFILTRNIWMTTGIHWTWNLFQGSVFGFPVSGTTEADLGFANLVTAEVDGPSLLTGGSFGPEAGLLAIAIGTAAGVCLLVVAYRKGRFIRPPWGRPRVPDGEVEAKPLPEPS